MQEKKTTSGVKGGTGTELGKGATRQHRGRLKEARKVFSKKEISTSQAEAA